MRKKFTRARLHVKIKWNLLEKMYFLWKRHSESSNLSSLKNRLRLQPRSFPPPHFPSRCTPCFNQRVYKQWTSPSPSSLLQVKLPAFIGGLQTSDLFLLLSDSAFATWTMAAVHRNWIIHYLFAFEVFLLNPNLFFQSLHSNLLPEP